MNLARILFAAVVAVCSAVAASGQQPTCNLKVENAPAVRGFRLGMSQAEVKKLHPQIEVRDNGFGQTNIYLDKYKLKAIGEAIAKDVDSISLGFLDERVTEIAVNYVHVSWDNVGQFAAKISEGLGLPVAWKTESESVMALDCGGVRVLATLSGRTSAYLRLLDPTVSGIVRQRFREREETQRQTFKP